MLRIFSTFALVAIVIALTCVRGRYIGFLCRRSFVAVLLTVIIRHVCLSIVGGRRHDELRDLLAWCIHVASCSISVRRRVQSPRHLSIASQLPAYFATEAIVAAPVHEDHVRLFINMTHFCTWVVSHGARTIDGTAVQWMINLVISFSFRSDESQKNSH